MLQFILFSKWEHIQQISIIPLLAIDSINLVLM